MIESPTRTPAVNGAATRSNTIAWTAAALAYAALTLAATWPLARRLSSAVAHDSLDPVLNAWILWWNAHHVPLTTAWWSPPSFYPAQGVLAFSEHLLGFAPLTSPLMWIGLSPIAAYNVAFLASFPLCALAMHALVRHLTGRHDVAVVAGLLFGFGPLRASQLAHLQVLWTFWMPLALLGLHEWLEGRRRGLWIFAAAWLFQGWSNGYFFFYFSVCVGLWLGWFVRTWRQALVVAGAWSVAGACMLPVLLEYRHWQNTYGFSRSIVEIEQMSADVASLLRATPELSIWGGRLLAPRAEGALFPGVTALVLTGLIAGWAWWRRAPCRVERRWWQWMLTVASSVVFLVALCAPVFGPWALSAGPFAITISTVHKPLSLALVLLAMYAVSSARFVRVYRSRSALAFYGIAAAALWLLSMGPTPSLGDTPVLYKAPYAWLMQLPGFDHLRVPARFGHVAMVALTVIVGVGLDRVLPRTGRLRVAAILVACVGVVADGWMQPIPLADAPGAWTLKTAPALGSVVLELPQRDIAQEVAAQYRMVFHGRPTFNGYSGYVPGHTAILEMAGWAPNPDVIRAARQAADLHVVIDRRHDHAPGWVAALRATPSARLLEENDTWSAWAVPRAAGPDSVDASRIDAAPVRVSAPPASIDLIALRDGDPATVWMQGRPQRPGERLDADFGRVVDAGALVMTQGPLAASFPRGLRIETAQQDGDWTVQWVGSVVERAFAGACANPRAVPIRVPIGSSFRYLRLTQTGTDDAVPWGLADVGVQFRPPQAFAAGAASTR